eukprot:GHVS01086183.1.p1 GENE.GHVS01086183.1~~GHVS01086183.1.p1  ORF type:complete len:329 (+),score=31.82 GHVS01086183.1:69-1055(+)
MEKILKAIQKDSGDQLETLLRTTTVETVNTVGKKGLAPIHAALDSGAYECLNILLNYEGLDINLKNTDSGWTPLIHAVASADIDTLQSVLNHKKCEINGTDEDGNTALHWAARFNQADAINELLDRRIKTATVNSDGAIALHVSLSEANEEAALVLINRHIDLIVKDREGNTPLHYCAMYKLGNTCKALLEQMECTGITCVDRMSDFTNALGETPLHLSCSSGNAAISSLLESYGFSREIRSNDGDSPHELYERFIEESQKASKQKATAKTEKLARRRQLVEDTKSSTGVAHFLQRSELGSFLDIFYSKKFKVVDDAFLSLDVISKLK